MSDAGGPIDAVITWVDGDDPAHRQALAALLASRGGPPPPAARAARFNDAGEIDYCVASILRFAPWIRTLHIVSGRQTPALMSCIAGTAFAGRIRVVDHREIFAGYECHLPTFNSRAIITGLWRIPDLAERFVYFNDDFMLLRPVTAQDFFRDDGRVVLRGRWARQTHDGWARRVGAWLKGLRRRGDAAGHHVAQERSARLAGFDGRYLQQNHSPYPMRRSTLEAFFAAHPALLEDNLRHRLRSSQQFKAESVSAHLELARGTAVVDDTLRLAQLKPRQQSGWRLRAAMRQAQRDTRCAFACVQSLELASPDYQADIRAWLERFIGRPRDAFDAETGPQRARPTSR